MAAKTMFGQPRTDFGPPPPGYIAGVGRGAIGFTTRSDIGPARPVGAAEPTAGAGATLPLGKGRALAAAQHLGIAPPPGFPGAPGQPGGLTLAQIQKATADRETTDYSDANFDAFAGFDEKLFRDTPYDEEDREADIIYETIERRQDSKRKRRREENEKEIEDERRAKRPIVQEQFATLKRQLADMKQDDWDAIPEALDYSGGNKFKQRMKEKFTPTPDSLVASARPDTQHVAMLDSKQQKYDGLATPVGGWQTPVGGAGDQAGSLRQVRSTVIGMKLDRMADSVTGQTVIDPKGYLTDLTSMKMSSEAEISDIKKAKLLLTSVITTNPKHAPGWIAAARLEKETGKIVDAREIIMKGCEQCPTNEDIWLEAVRLHPPKSAKVILGKAVTKIPTSVKLWMRARDLEEDVEAKKAVLRRALEFIPKSVALWKAAVELENPKDATIMLGRAVDLIPESTELWLALARLEDYKNARAVLNRARAAIPTEPAIWITAAKLEEAHGISLYEEVESKAKDAGPGEQKVALQKMDEIKNQAQKTVSVIIERAIQSLAGHHVEIDRDHWLQEAENCEKSGSILTCQAIIQHTIGQKVDEQDRKSTWDLDAENMIAKGSIATARAIYQHMLGVFPSNKRIWLSAAQLEKQHGTKEQLEAVLRKGVGYCPQAEILWLMAAKEKWLSGDVNEARRILNDAFSANPDNEQIWLAAVKLEREVGEYHRARAILAKAREQAPTPRIWRHSARLEQMLGDKNKQHQLLTEGLHKFGTYPKLWIMMAEFLTEAKKIDEAREVFKNGVKACPQAVDLWLAYADLEANQTAGLAKARSILETARLRCPKNPQLWLAAIKIEQKVEQKAEHQKVAQQLMAKALQECPTAGILWAHAIAADPRPARRARSFDALKKCSNDPQVFAAVAKLFWLEGPKKRSKTREWFHRAVTVAPDEGDIWAAYYKFELEVGDQVKIDALVKKCVEHEPRHGELWRKVRRQLHKHSPQSIKTDVLLKAVAAEMKTIFEETGTMVAEPGKV